MPLLRQEDPSVHVRLARERRLLGYLIAVLGGSTWLARSPSMDEEALQKRVQHGRCLVVRHLRLVLVSTCPFARFSPNELGESST